MSTYDTEGAGYLHSLVTAPPHNLPNLSLSVGVDLDKLKVPPLSSVCYFRVGGAPSGPHSDMLYEVLSTTFSVKDYGWPRHRTVAAARLGPGWLSSLAARRATWALRFSSSMSRPELVIKMSESRMTVGESACLLRAICSNRSAELRPKRLERVRPRRVTRVLGC